MKKIYSIKERTISILIILVLSVITIYLLANYLNNVFCLCLCMTCITFSVLAFAKLTSMSSQIIIENNHIKFFHFPLGATNKFYDKKRSLILWNNEMYISEIEEIELIKLTTNEQKIYLGYKYLFNKFLKFSFKYGHSKYVYVGHYSNPQIQKIIKTINTLKETQTYTTVHY